MISKKNIHEKLLNCIQEMLIDTKVNLPFYGEFNLHIAFHEQDSIGTCAVNCTTTGMNFFFSPKFLENMSQKEVNFIVIHEDFHLLFNHPKRTITGQYNHKLSNIAQDMIINHVIWEDLSHDFVEIPKDSNGNNMALFVPKEYTGKLIFEELYEWLKEEKEKWDKQQKKNCKCKSCDGTGQKGGKDKSKEKGNSKDKGDQDGDQKGNGGNQPSDEQSDDKGQPGKGKGKNPSDEKTDQEGEGEGKGEPSKEKGKGQGNGEGNGEQGEPCPDCNGTGNEEGKDSTGKPSYGPYGKNPSNKNDKNDSIDTWSKEQIFENMEKNEGQYLDKHIGDDIPEEMRDAIVKDVMEKLQSRGLTAGNIETTLNKLRKKRKDYLKEIKRSISNTIFGTIKQRTIAKPNRREISGLKGNRKIKTQINVGLDTSGSMGGQGTFERVLNYVYQNDIEINFMESDTQVNWVKKLKSKKALETIPIKGLGGTCLQPMIDYIVEHHNDCNSVLLGDGYCDNLDFSKVKGKVLIISVGVKFPIAKSNGKVKQICIENTH